MIRRPATNGLAILALALAVSGCESPEVKAAHDAEQRLAMVKGTGDKDAICTASNDVAEAWLRALDNHQYQMAKLEASTACLDADMARYQLEHG